MSREAPQKMILKIIKKIIKTPQQHLLEYKTTLLKSKNYSHRRRGCIFH